jgi:hypothetical protein
MSRPHLLSIAVASLLLGALTPGTASAAHFYLQLESNEEFKQISSTVEATLASNAEITFVWESLGKHFEILCHSEGREELFTSGTASLTELKLTLCEAFSNKVHAIPCNPKKITISKLPAKATLTEFGEPLTYGQQFSEFKKIVFELGELCSFGEIYCVESTSKPEAEFFNTITLEMIFPEPALKGTSLQGCGAKLILIQGRYRVSPTIGRALKVGP